MTGPTTLPASQQGQDTSENSAEVTSDVAHILYCNSSKRRSLCRMCVAGRRKGNKHSYGCGTLLAVLVCSYWSFEVPQVR